MSITELQKFTYISKYAKWNKNSKKRESWDECVNTVRDMHKRKYPQLADEIDEAFEFVRKKKVLPSQRTLQFGGSPIEKHNLRAFNCSFSPCNRLRFFQETMYALLCGCGVGFSVQKHHIAKLPEFNNYQVGRIQFDKSAQNEYKVYIIPDTIEGWANSIGVLLSNYFNDPVFPEYSGNAMVMFDYGAIRPKGSLLSSGTGRAPGPEPLQKALEEIEKVLINCVSNGYRRLRPIDAYDIVMHIADAVLSGGVRRSSCITLFSLDDEEMIASKTGNWLYDNPQRQRSNNSVLLLRHETTFEQFIGLINSIKEYGEPGFIWADDKEFGTNPCGEASFYCYDIDGTPGFQFCNLSTVNGKKCKNKEDFIKACKIASLIGTIQAGYTDFPYLTKASENITKREALIGVSICGMMDKAELLFDPDVQKIGAQAVVEENIRVAKLININPSARCTVIKPEGTTSLLLGSSSGIHPHHARRYIRRVKCNQLEVPYQYFKAFNIHATEKDYNSANQTDDFIMFPIEVPDGAKLKNEVSALELLRCVRDTYVNWINFGKNKSRCVKPWLSHNVSNTITVKQEEWDDVAKFIYENRHYLCGVSLLSYFGDKDYVQAPFTTVLTPAEIVREYGDASIFASGIIEKAIEAFDKNLWLACDVIQGKGNIECNKKQKEWVVKAQQFAQRYFSNDIKTMTYCLKDVYNWKLYTDLIRDFSEVNYDNMIEDNDNTNYIIDAPSCIGGKCEI